MSTETLWIVIAVVVAVLLIAVVVGLVVARKRRISLRDDEEIETGEKEPPKGGSYKASGSFNFASGTATAPERPRDLGPAALPDVPPAGPTTPGDGRTAVPATGDTTDLSGPTGGTATAEPPTTADPGTAGTATAEPGATTVDDTATADDVRTPPGGTPVAGGATEARTPPGGITVVDAPTPPRGTPAAPAGQSPVIDTAEASKDPATARLDTRTADAPSQTAPTTPTTAAPATDETAVVAPGAPTEDIAPADGRLGRLRGQLSRSRSGFGQSLLGLLGAGQMDEESWEDVEATLLQADLGPEMTEEITTKLRELLASRGVRTAEQARTALRDVLTEALDTNQDRSVRALPHDGRPAVLLVVGVNGTGKTTTTGKLARVLVAGGHRVTLGAADTFRAAAAEQLVTWGERSGAGVVRGPEGSDPASVAFDAVKRGTADGVDAVLLDTAGRLHTKTGLMDELGKVKRVVEKQARVDEVLLVLDATTGQNGLTQARVFGDVVDVTGIALTKLDGTAKGGIVFRVQRELGVPVKLVGLGEGPDDLAPFEPSAFVEALLD